MDAKVEDFPAVEAKILHALGEPKIPDIQEEAFANMIPQLVRPGLVREALKRYHEYANGEIARGLAGLDAFNKAVTDKRAELHVEDAVGAARAREA